MIKVEKAIIKTLAFFDILGRPLTLEEIWRFLYRVQASQLQVLMGLQKLQKGGQINKRNSYYTLKGRQNIISASRSKEEVVREHWRKVSWVVKILRYVPCVKAICVINSLACNTSNDNSDIDIVLITKKNRLWTTRALIIFLLEIIGQNKNKWFKAGKFCLGFAFDEERLSWRQFFLKDDVYTLYYWLANMVPVFDREIYKKFLQANSRLYEILPNWQPRKCKNPLPTARHANAKFKIIEKILSRKFGDKLEKWLAKIQIQRIWGDPIHHRKGASVIADESMMKLHAYDRREEFRKIWQKKVLALTKYG